MFEATFVIDNIYMRNILVQYFGVATLKYCYDCHFLELINRLLHAEQFIVLINVLILATVIILVAEFIALELIAHETAN